MKWPAKYSHVDYPNGATRLKRIFAWLPTQVGDTMIWLTRYEMLQAYIIQEYVVMLDPKKPKDATTFSKGQWIEISKRLMK